MKPEFIHIREVLKHKFWVALYMTKIAARLFIRGIFHDTSKFFISETTGYAKALPRILHLPYYSKEYKECLKIIKPSVELHYKRNSHHPEHFASYKEMNIYDLMEMVCDWKSAAKRHKDGNLNKSFKISQERFQMDNETVRILKTLL